jgi:hypothetical protein
MAFTSTMTCSLAGATWYRTGQSRISAVPESLLILEAKRLPNGHGDGCAKVKLVRRLGWCLSQPHTSHSLYDRIDPLTPAVHVSCGGLP